jgi:sugar phosphate isomerase/epimerase
LRAQANIPVALQLFSLRTQCELDLQGTLAYLREVGFRGVELAGLYGRTPAQMRALLDENSLECCGSHTPLPELIGPNFDRTVAANQTLRNRNLVVPGLPKKYEASPATWKAAAAVLNRIAERLQPLGMRVGYHNHDIEFRALGDITPWAVLFQNTRPDVILELDTGNARVAGADPTTLIRRYPGRAVMVHVKDYLPGQLDPVLGSSSFDWKEFARTCQSSGSTEWFIIEHDSHHREEAKLCFDHFEQLR